MTQFCGVWKCMEHKSWPLLICLLRSWPHRRVVENGHNTPSPVRCVIFIIHGCLRNPNGFVQVETTHSKFNQKFTLARSNYTAITETINSVVHFKPERLSSPRPCGGPSFNRYRPFCAFHMTKRWLEKEHVSEFECDVLAAVFCGANFHLTWNLNAVAYGPNPIMRQPCRRTVLLFCGLPPRSHFKLYSYFPCVHMFCTSRASPFHTAYGWKQKEHHHSYLPHPPP